MRELTRSIHVTAAASVRAGDFINGCSIRNRLFDDNSVIRNVDAKSSCEVDVEQLVVPATLAIIPSAESKLLVQALRFTAQCHGYLDHAR